MTDRTKFIRERLLALIENATGTRDVFNVPLESFDGSKPIDFSKVRGNVRLMNGLVATESDDKVFIDEVLLLELP